MRVLHWFRNDLRIHDHRVFGRAHDLDVLIPVYILDPRKFENSSLGFPRQDYYRIQFLNDSLNDLNESLEKLGSKLIIKFGKPEDVIKDIADQYNIDLVTVQKEYAFEEIEDEERVRKSLNCKFSTFHGRTLYHPNDVVFDIEKTPDVFTAFRKKVEKYAAVKEEYPTPTSLPAIPEEILSDDFPDLSVLGVKQRKIDRNTAFPYEGGEKDALARLEDYIWRRKLIRSYKYTRNQLIGESFSSKFSPWLANGSISPRTIYWATKNHEKEHGSNSSTYWLIFELIWRDYFKFVMMKYGQKFFHKGGILNKSRKYFNKESNFLDWINGETGEPFVDANMKELKLTGWMSNRGRQNVASYLCKDLQVDWRWGAEWFESQLIDYDVESNRGNWMYVAGVGNDPREDRYFNVKKQAERYDPKNEFVELWNL